MSRAATVPHEIRPASIVPRDAQRSQPASHVPQPGSRCGRATSRTNRPLPFRQTPNCDGPTPPSPAPIAPPRRPFPFGSARQQAWRLRPLSASTGSTRHPSPGTGFSHRCSDLHRLPSAQVVRAGAVPCGPPSRRAGSALYERSRVASTTLLQRRQALPRADRQMCSGSSQAQASASAKFGESASPSRRRLGAARCRGDRHFLHARRSSVLPDAAAPLVK